MPTKAMAPIGRRHAIWGMALVAVLTLTSRPVGAQDPFHIAYTVERGGGSGPTRVNGRVVNEGTFDAFDVYLTAEALDASGKVLGRGIVFVGSSIPARGIAPFSISIPAAQAATGFRVRVSSFRQGIGQQAG